MKLGINGSGFFENADALATSLIKDFNELYIRVPGGAISRFHEPFTNRQGWGITAANVNEFFDNYDVGPDEDDPNGGRDKWLQKAADQPNYSYLDSLIQLSNEMLGLRVIYVINVFTSNAEEQLNTLTYLITNGVRVDVVEFGNEVYGKYEFNTDAYLAYCAPLISTIKQTYPSVKVSLISGNFKGRRDHNQWNSQLAEYVNNPENQVDYVTLHFYIGSDLAPDAYQLLPAPKIVDYTRVDEALMAACDSYVEEVIDSERFQEEVDSAKAIYNTPIIVTEWNNNPASAWCNTMVNGSWIYTTALTLEGVDILCLHNGVSPDMYGMICRKKQQDDFTTEMVPRVSYHVMKLADEFYKAVDEGYVPLDGFSIPHAGLFIIPFAYYGGGTFLVDAPGYSTSFEFNFIEGLYPYSSAGVTGFQAKNQPKNMEVKGITTVITEEASIGNETPAYRIGFVKVNAAMPDSAPIAYAGEDKLYRIGKGETVANVVLDASGSYDANGNIVAYSWTCPGVTPITGVDYTTPVSVFLPVGEYYFTLTVTDNSGGTSQDTVKITVKKKKGFSFGNIINLKDGTLKTNPAKNNLKA